MKIRTSKIVYYIPVFSAQWRTSPQKEDAYFFSDDEEHFTFDESEDIVKYCEEEFSLEEAIADSLERFETLKNSGLEYEFSDLRVEKREISAMTKEEEVWRYEMGYNCECENVTPSMFLRGTRVMCRNGKWADVVNFSDNTQYLWFGGEEEPLALNMFDKKWRYCIPNVDRVESGAINWDIMEAYDSPVTVNDIPLSAAAGERELIWKRIRTITKEEIEEILGYEIEITG